MKRQNHQSTTRRAFTLIELLIVIAILLTIGGIVVVNLLPQKERADADLVKVQIDRLEAALKLFKFNMDRYPTEEEGLAALWTASVLEDEEDEARWTGPYLEKPIPTDKWGHEWIYRYPGEIAGEQFYDIISVGPDGEEDTEDDIHNHMREMDEEGELGEEFEDFGTEEDLGNP